MSTSDTPTDPQQLREEIAQTRAELGATVEALAAKADVKTRAKQAATDMADRARHKLLSAKTRTVQGAGAARQRLSDPSGSFQTTIAPARQQAAALKGRAVEAGRHPQVRRAAPVAAVSGALLVAGVVLVVVRRRRS